MKSSKLFGCPMLMPVISKAVNKRMRKKHKAVYKD
jgi:hypothetical protein